MFSPRLVLAALLIFALLAPGTTLAQPAASPTADTPPAPHGSMLFIENAGQWPEEARYQVWGGPAGTMWLAGDAIWITVVERGEGGTLERWNVETFERSNVEPADGQGVNVKITFPGSNPNVRIEPFDPVDTTVSYFLGNDPAQWHPDVPVWGGVRYADLYPGVDLVLGGREGGWQLEAAPGAAIEQVSVQIEGASVASVDDTALQLDGEALTVWLPSAPFTYQASGSSRQGTPLVLRVQSFPRAPHPASPADNPADLLYSTFLGGSESDWGFAIAVDATGKAYVAGHTESPDFPTTPGTFDPGFDGIFDAFVVKLNPTGSGLDYATFLGGNGDDLGAAIAVDTHGSAYVAGHTSSGNFPATPGAFDPSFNGGDGDAFAAKLNPAGSSLAYSTYLGATENDWAFAIAVDGAGSAYLAGVTQSTGFPATSGSFDPSFNGGLWDAFAAKLNPTGSGLAYATFLGGTNVDGIYAIAVDGLGSAYLTGFTASNNFPTTPGAFDTSLNDSVDAFAAKLNPAGSRLAFATFLGGTDDERGYAIAVDGATSTYVTGWTMSVNFPITPGAFDSSYNGGTWDAFVLKMNSTGSNLTYSTFLGGGGGDYGRAIAVDGAGRAHVTGITESNDFPFTSGAFDPSFNGSADAFVSKLDPTGNGLDYATFLGGSRSETGYGIAVDGAGCAYIAGWTMSSDFPTTPGAFDRSLGDYEDAFVAKLDLQPYTSNVLAPIEQPSAGAFVSGTVTVSGFAIDLGSTSGTGIDAVHVYLDGPYGTGTIIGAATYGLDRPDVAAQYGARFAPSGWELPWNTAGLTPGVHRLYLYAHRTTDNTWSLMPAHLVLVPGGHPLWLPAVSRNQ